MIKKLTSFFIILFLFGTVLPVRASSTATPNDPFYNQQWYLTRVDAEGAWQRVTSSPDVVVAVIDSGIDINHPDLKNNIWTNPHEIAGNGLDDDHNGFIDDVHGWDFVDNVPDPSPKFEPGWTEAGVSHGTMVAGIIAAEGNNGIGVTGVAWKTKIMPLRVLNDKGEGKTSSVIRAIDYAVNNGADIINLSFATLNYSAALQGAIDRAHQAGVIIVAAAGNDQLNGDGYDTDKTPIYPACLDGTTGPNTVIGVAATDALDQKASFSSYGQCVDITAPGISFFNTITPGSNTLYPNREYDGYWSGTSMAAPVVTGAIALVMQADPELSNQEVINLVLGSADNITLLNPKYFGKLGHGRLNIDRAVAMARERLYSSTNRLLIAPQTGAVKLKVDRPNGATVKEIALKNLANGAHITSADLFGDDQAEIIAGAGKGDEPYVSIYDQSGKLLKKFLAYNKDFRGGVEVATGNLRGDGQIEIITAPSGGGGPQIRIFNQDGRVLNQFFAGDKKSRGGLSIATGDINNDGQDELIVGAGIGQKPTVSLYNADLKLNGIFFAYPQNFRGGVNVAATNLYGRAHHQKQEIITAPRSNYDSLIKVYNNRGQSLLSFDAYNSNWQNGVTVTAGDIDNDGYGEIITGANGGATPHVRVFNNQGTLEESFYAYNDDFSGGVNVSLINLEN
jgi:subtilisin family serine protease